MSKLTHTLSKSEKARVRQLVEGLVKGRITEWTLPNHFPMFDSEGAKRISKKLAKTGLLLRHMRSAKRHYAV